jgi:hypothetical protein
MTGKTASAGDEDLLAAYEEQMNADLREIEALKKALAEKQEAFRARHLRVLAALERT